MWVVFATFLCIGVLMMMFSVIVDILRDTGASGLAKAGWLLTLFLLPLIGVLVYVIAHGDDMARRSADERAQQQRPFDDRVRAGVGARATSNGPGRCAPTASSRTTKFTALKQRILY